MKRNYLCDSCFRPRKNPEHFCYRCLLIHKDEEARTVDAHTLESLGRGSYKKALEGCHNVIARGHETFDSGNKYVIKRAKIRVWSYNRILKKMDRRAARNASLL